MKQRIFNRGKGWYIVGNNFKDENDKAYCNLYFPQNSAPNYALNSQGWAMADIDILEAKYTSFKGVIGMTIFKYVLLNNDRVNEQKYPQIKTENEHDYFKEEDTSPKVEISMDELPFY